MQCEYCSTTENIEYTYDPYAWEIYDEKNYMWLCDSCWQSRADDI